MRRENDKVAHHQTAITLVCTVLLLTIHDGDINLPLAALVHTINQFSRVAD